MKNLVENVIEGKEKTAESTISPVGEVEGQVAEILGLDWTPLVNEKLEAHAEEILTGIFERIPGLMVSTSPNQY